MLINLEGSIYEVNKIEFHRYIKAAEEALKHQGYGGAVIKRKEEKDSVTFACEMSSKNANNRIVFVSICNTIRNRLDITFYCICDSGSKLGESIGENLASELTKKYRLVKCYIKSGLDKFGNKGCFFIGEYNFLFYQDTPEKFEINLAEITGLIYSILGDIVDIEEEVFGKNDEDLKLKNDMEDRLLFINPNPFK